MRTVCTIGMFDGVHMGHRFLLQQVKDEARKRGLRSVAVTFRAHPSQILRQGPSEQLLSLPEEKEALLKAAGIDEVTLLDFTPELAQMTALEFMRTVLKERLKAETLVIGYDNRFGHDGKSFDDYVRYGKELGMEVVSCAECVTAEHVSSTTIRQALLQGDVARANTLLGRPYTLQGTVVSGFQNGRKLGYPTANLQVEQDKLIPANGAYLVRVEPSTSNVQELPTQGLADSPSTATPHTWAGQLPWPGMLNIGTRPTLHNGQQRSIEVHLFDFHGNLYGQSLRVELLAHLRGEKEFDSVEALQQQLAADKAACLQLLQHSQI